MQKKYSLVNSMSFYQQSSNALVTELAKLLQIAEIDDSTLQLCVKLLDQGVDPEALAHHIVSINKETRSGLR